MKDMFGRKLNKWDIVVAQDEDGDLYLCVVAGDDDDDEGYAMLRQVLPNNDLDESFSFPAEYTVLLSPPEDLKIKLDTMKFAGEEL